MTRLLCLLFGLLLLVGCSTSNPVVPKEPPPIKKEFQPRKPGPGVFWKDGHYAWKEDTGVFYWVNGGWENERDGWIWYPGNWAPVNDGSGKRLGWQWTDDRWVRRSDAGLPPD